MRLHRIIVVVAALLTLALPAAAQSDYPSRKITLMVGFAPGGGVDVLARVVARELDEQGLQAIVENRPGAASNIAAKLVAGSAPDGYTLLFTGNSYAINQTLYKNPGYATEELRAVAFAALDSQALAVNAGHPARNLTEFLTAAKEKPVNAGYGGSSARIVSEYVLKIAAKAQVITVPFQSGAPALNALLGKHVDIISGPVAEFVPQVQQGAIRVLAVTGAKRHESLPDVPTLSEVGFPGLEIQGWIGILAPAKTSDEICAKVNAAVNAAVAKPAVNARLRSLGYSPNQMPLTDTGPFLKTSIETWGRMIRETGISAQ